MLSIDASVIPPASPVPETTLLSPGPKSPVPALRLDLMNSEAFLEKVKQ